MNNTSIETFRGCKRPSIVFRLHALDKLYGGEDERTALTESEIIQIIESGKIVPIGHDGHKKHLLFFSPRDQRHYVLVQDSNNLEIITVLHVTYHNRWRLSDDVLIEAEKLHGDSAREQIRPPLCTQLRARGGPRTKIVVKYLRYRKVTLGKLPEFFPQDALKTPDGLEFAIRFARELIGRSSNSMKIEKAYFPLMDESIIDIPLE